jgi:predicted ArsR family transcriptional regulator
MKDDKTKLKIIEILKWKGPSSQDALAKELGLSTMAVSKHLTNYLSQGLVSFEERRQERGRPIKFWSPTKDADKFFPNTHNKLAQSLISITKEALGDDALEKLLGVHTAKKVTQYREEIEKVEGGLGERVHKLAQIRNQEGYLAEYRQEDDTHILIENHCPICDVASQCGDLCNSELSVMEQVLGPNITIERTEHIQSDDRRCFYKIKEADPQS